MDGMVDVDRNPDCHEQEHRTRRAVGDGAYDPCWICGRVVRNPKHWLHIHEGGAVAVTEAVAATLDPNADMGCYPIGTDCLKKHPELKAVAEDATRVMLAATDAPNV